MKRDTLQSMLESFEDTGAFQDRPEFEAFTRAYIRHTARALTRNTPQELLRFLEGRYQFLDEGDPDTITVRVENPSNLSSTIDDDDGLADAGPFITRVEVHSKDRPFIMSTIQEYFHRREIKVVRCFHPIFCVERNSVRRVESIRAADTERPNESLVFMEVERIGDIEDCHKVRNDLVESLQGVRVVTDDFQAILKEVDAAVKAVERPGFPPGHYDPAEIVEFLKWAEEENFVFHGYRYYRFPDGPEGEPEPDRATSLGILRLEHGLDTMREALEREITLHVSSRAVSEYALSVLRTDVYSRVHRAHPLDYLGLKDYDAHGKLVGERVFIGSFSNKTITEKVARIPILRNKKWATIEALGLMKNTHYFKRAVYVINTIPKEDLFYSTVEELASTLEILLGAEEIAECQVFARRSTIGKRLSLIVVLPKLTYHAEVKERVYARLAEFFGVDHLREYVAWSEEQTLRLHYYISQPERDVDDEQLEELRRELTRLVRPWRNEFAELLHHSFPGSEGERLAKKYRNIFPDEYQSVYAPETAVVDTFCLETLFATGEPQCTILNTGREHHGSSTELRVYHNKLLALNDIVPILANFDLEVLDEDYTRITPRAEPESYIYSFHVHAPLGAEVTESLAQDRLSDAVGAILRGHYSDHALNSLILSAELDWEEVDLLVGYRNYYLQLNKDYTPSTVDASLTEHPQMVRLFLKYFRHRFDPDEEEFGDRKYREEVTLPAITAEIKNALAGVAGIAEDKILRNFSNLLTSTLRTSFFKAMGRKVLSLKIDSSEVWEMPEPRPYVETYVHAQKVEGIHLRGGAVARGGLRWSDRKDDFRTEVLELMKTQMTKNALIVPVGAKGGFFPDLGDKQGKDRQEEALNQYRIFIRGLLELADSWGPSGGEVRPEGVFCWDAFDPYLVVAADKGTATYSDDANDLSAEYKFWLGDAFASGGSIGYSHKELGITARGAWECVKRHFRELGKDIQREDFTCVGIGDMAGDVFGNGMLLSEHIRLVGAFNHVHVFLDPDPDAAVSFQERKRLFEDPKLTWMDYDRSKISEGGGVYSRADKVIKLSPQAREALGTTEEVVNGEELITLILTAPAELLWNGGIGTYVKASSENHHQVRDKANDRVRVDARDLRCKVIGEGGNLGFTQQARLEFLGGGGLMNTDAIDNSGGVDMSDHEVNLKILMDLLQRKGLIPDQKARNQLLRELTQEVIDLVLHHNYTQSQVLSLDSFRSQESATPFIQLVHHLEQVEGLNRRVEGIGDDSSLLNFQVSGRGIPRAVLAVLLAYAKRSVYAGLLDSSLPDAGPMQRYLIEYFPRPVHERFRDAIFEHRLRREIIATVLANTVVDQAGMTYIQSETVATGRTTAAVVESYLLTDAFLGGPDIRKAIWSLDNEVAADVQYDALMVLEDTIASISRYLLSWQNFAPLAWENLEMRRKYIDMVVDGLQQRLPESLAQQVDARVKHFTDCGMDDALSRRIAFLPYLRHLLGLVRVAEEADLELLDVAQVFFRVGNDLRFDWLQERATQVTRANEWEVQFLNRLSTELYFLQGEISKAVIRSRTNGQSIEELLQRFYEERADRIQVIHRELERLAASGVNNLIPIDLFRDHYREIILSP